MAPYIAQAVGEALQLRFEVSSAQLSWNRITEPPEIRIANVIAVDDSERVVAGLPELAVGLSLTSLFDGAAAPESIILINPTVRFSRLNDGTLAVGIDPDGVDVRETDNPQSTASDSEANPILPILLDAVTGPGTSENPGGYLQRAIIRDATIIFYDQASAVEWQVPKGQAQLERAGDDVRIDVILPLKNAEQDSGIEIVAFISPEKEAVNVSVEFERVRPSTYAPLAPDIAFLAGLNVDITGSAHFEMGLEQDRTTFKNASLNVTSGKGVAALAAPILRDYPIADLALALVAENDFDLLTLTDGHVDLVSSGEKTPSISLTAQIKNLKSAPTAEAQIGIDYLTLDDLKAFWPEDIKPNTRNWITRNLTGGYVEAATFEVTAGGESFENLDATEFSGRAGLFDIDVTYMRGMSPAEDVDGEMVLGLDEVEIDVFRGYVDELSSDGRLELTSGEIRLHGLDTREHMADIDLVISGDLQDAISLIDQEPLKYASALGIDPCATSGRAQVLLSVDFPLVQELTLAEVRVGAEATVEDTRLDNAVFGLPLDSGQFRLTLDNAGMDVIGTASIGGIRTGLTWRENFQDARFKRQYAVDAILENEQRALVNLSQPAFGPPYVNGPVRVEAIYTIDDSDAAQLDLEADISGAAIAVPQLNWKKSNTVAGLLTAQMTISDDVLRSINEFSVESEGAGLRVSGQAQFSNDGQVETIRLNESQIGKSVFAVEARRNQSGVVEISADSSVLDGTAFWQSLRQSDRARSFEEDLDVRERPEFVFNGQIERLLLSPNGALLDVRSDIEQEKEGLSKIRIEGRVPSGELFLLTMDPADGGSRVFSAESENGGAVLQALGLGNDFVAGQLKADGKIDEFGAVDGLFSIKTFKVVDAPLLARLLSVAALTGIVDELEGQGISFTELKLPFSYSENIFRIDNGSMYGPSLGLTARGQYDTQKATLDGEGTLIPAYAVNSAMGSIPILGPILTGGEKDGGVFAATYTMRGNPDGGEITVNPLATLTPGFLRQIFRVFDPPPAKPSSNADDVPPSG